MDSKSIGAVIASLRRREGMTQAQLARELNVTCKAVSRWESGQGYPEITQFPALASLFGVSIDYLMTGQRRGIAVAGNILTDLVKSINCYPAPGMLANILSISRSVGGCAPNTAIDLAKIDRKLPVSVLGCVGDDEQGQYLLNQLRAYGINVDGVSVLPDCATSFSDVMSLPTGERTFFHARGANARFSPEHVDLSSLNCSLLHIGYILLLDAFDREDPEYGTVMARFLHDVQEKGIKTSIDAVSDSTGQYRSKILPALRYCDYAIMNEIECCSVLDLQPRDAKGKLNAANLQKAMQTMAQAGVREKVIIHAREVGFCLDVKTGSFTQMPSLKLPASVIKGSVGAGDAYAAGCLYGIYHGYCDQELLRFASAAAACNLFAANSVDGMLPKQEILKQEEKYGRLEKEI